MDLRWISDGSPADLRWTWIASYGNRRLKGGESASGWLHIRQPLAVGNSTPIVGNAAPAQYGARMREVSAVMGASGGGGSPHQMMRARESLGMMSRALFSGMEPPGGARVKVRGRR